MITLPVGALLMVYVGAPLLFIGGLALFYKLRSRHQPVSKRERIYECTSCGHVYAIARSRPMDRCPRCSQLNDAVRT